LAPVSISYLSTINLASVLRSSLLIIIVAILLPAITFAQNPRVDPDTGKIRTLFIGDPFLQPGYPTLALIEDPKIQLTRIEAEIGYRDPVRIGIPRMQRFLRLYLPRSRSDLIDNYDMLIVTAIRSNDLKIQFQLWAKEAVEEHGFGFMMSDDPTSFGGADTVWTTGPPWDPTPVGDILPVKGAGVVSHRDHMFRLKPTGDSPLTNGIPWEGMPLIWSHNRPDPKGGSTVLAVTTDETVDTDPKNDEIIIYWEYGEGRSLAFIWDWGGNGLVPFYRWDYWKDFIARLVYFPVRAEIPQDLTVTHTLRVKIGQYESEKDLVLSLIEFADTFGANTNDLNRELGATDDLRDEVDRLWIEEEYEECLPAMEEALSSLKGVMDSAMEAKDRALLWVYLIEWLTVAGTSIITGVVVWTLMVRRRLYKQVAATRFES